MLNQLSERSLNWIGDLNCSLTQYYFLQEFYHLDYRIESWVSFIKWGRADGTLDFEQRYAYKVFGAGGELLTNQRGLQLIHPDQAADCARNWINKNLAAGSAAVTKEA